MTVESIYAVIREAIEYHDDKEAEADAFGAEGAGGVKYHAEQRAVLECMLVAGQRREAAARAVKALSPEARAFLRTNASELHDEH